MYTNSKLAKSVRLALIYGASATAFGGISAATAQDEDEAAVDRTERIQVTGSRIQRTDMEGALPVTVIDRAAIDMSGENSVTDVIRNTTFNTAGSFRPQSGNAAGATASVDMRGLGSSRTLVLVDGRRLPTSPLTGSNQDLNVVPLGMVERIEVLSDGASAVYGSDAIGGVINIITRRDFNGAEFRYGEGTVSLPSEGGDREEGSVVFGASSDTSSLLGGVSWNNRDIIFENAYPWADQEPWSGYGNNWAELTSTGGFPGAANAQAFLNGCGDEIGDPNFFIRDNPNTQQPGCSYNFNASNANEASTGNQSIFLKGRHELNNDWSIFFNSSYTKTKSFGRYAATLNDTPTIISADSMNNPTNPDSPLYQDIDRHGDPIGDAREVAVFHRFAALGNRDSFADNYTRDFMVGTEGRVGNFDVDLGVRRTNSKVFDIGTGYLLGSSAGDAIEDGSYMLNDPYGNRFADDPEAADDYQALLNSFNVTISRISEFQLDEVFGSAAFDITDLNAGTVQAVVGFEYREETYSDQYDGLSEAGVVGGSSGGSAGGERDVTAFYGEMLVPLTFDLELTVAGRFDDYSDYGSDFSPKVGLRWQPIQELVVRGSWGQGFRAPTLDILTMQPSIGNPSVRDWVLCTDQGLPLTADDCPAQQIRSETIANDELSSESSTQFSLGVAYQPTEWLNMTVDYYDIEIKDAIRFFDTQTLIDRELSGDALPDDVFLTREDGIITGARQGYSNVGTRETSGLDFNFQTNFDFGEMGRLTQNLQLSYVINDSEDGGRNRVQDPGQPESRMNFTNTYTFGDFDFGWNVNLIGSTYASAVSTPTEDGFETTREGHIGSWTTHDLQVSYNTAWDGRITVGARNAFEKTPQLVAFGGRAYNFNLYDAYGRIMYFRYTQRF